MPKVQKWGNSQGLRFPRMFWNKHGSTLVTKSKSRSRIVPSLSVPGAERGASTTSRSLSPKCQSSTSRSKKTGAMRWERKPGRWLRTSPSRETLSD